MFIVYEPEVARQFDMPLPLSHRTLATLRLQEGSVKERISWFAGRLHTRAVNDLHVEFA
jgi:hypothetical protein